MGFSGIAQSSACYCLNGMGWNQIRLCDLALNAIGWERLGVDEMGWDCMGLACV